MGSGLMMSGSGYQPLPEQPIQNKPFNLGNMAKPATIGTSAPNQPMPTTRLPFNGPTFGPTPSNPSNLVNGIPQSFLQSAENGGTQALYDPTQSSLANILNGRWRTADDATGVINPAQGSTSFQNTYANMGIPQFGPVPKGGGLTPVTMPSMRSTNPVGMINANSPIQGPQSFRGGATAATPSNDRPLGQTSQTEVGAGNKPTVTSYSRIQDVLQQSPQYQAWLRASANGAETGGDDAGTNGGRNFQ